MWGATQSLFLCLSWISLNRVEFNSPFCHFNSNSPPSCIWSEAISETLDSSQPCLNVTECTQLSSESPWDASCCLSLWISRSSHLCRQAGWAASSICCPLVCRWSCRPPGARIPGHTERTPNPPAPGRLHYDCHSWAHLGPCRLWPPSLSRETRDGNYRNLCHTEYLTVGAKH